MRNLSLALFLSAFVAVGFIGGFATSISIVGDTMVERDGAKNACMAYNPATREQSPTWAPRSDGMCHLSDYWWKFAFAKFWDR